MDIYITEVDSNNKVQLPVTPGTIKVDVSGRFIQYDIMKKGEVDVPEGRQLTQISWEGIFPGKARENEPWVSVWADPADYDATFKQWSVDEPVLRLVITDSNVNIDVYLVSYSASYSGGYGDISYNVQFKAVDTLKIEKVTTSKSENKSSTATRTTKSVAKTYTIQSGDSLWAIAEKVYSDGSQWNKLYSANSDIIEKAAKSRGQSTSNKGSLIYPGTTINIP